MYLSGWSEEKTKKKKSNKRIKWRRLIFCITSVTSGTRKVFVRMWVSDGPHICKTAATQHRKLRSLLCASTKLSLLSYDMWPCVVWQLHTGVSEVSVPYMLRISAKCHAIPLQVWTGHEGSRRLTLPDFKTISTWNGKVVSLTYRPPLSLRKYSWYSFLLEGESMQGHSAVGRIMWMKNERHYSESNTLSPGLQCSSTACLFQRIQHSGPSKGPYDWPPPPLVVSCFLLHPSLYWLPCLVLLTPS
jgi:hypothetical protein